MPRLFAAGLISAVLVFGANQQAGSTRGAAIVASIDATKTGEPISPYIYGQFIEHIGDTVNRSLWAEMLDDRKFYYKVDSTTEPRASRGRRPNPWRPIGPDESVTMDTSNPYTGKHSPRIQLAGAAPRGIAQAGIALKNGRPYTGRVVLAGDPGASVSVSLVWGSGANDRQTIRIERLRSDYAKFPLRFTPLADSDNGRLEITGTGQGAFHIGAVSLMPADNIRGFRADTVLLLRQLRTGMWRFPGGNFISAYEWRETIGDIDRRPPRWDPVWNALQPNDVGIDEFLFMAELLNVDSFISASAGFGDAHSAAELVEYVNGSIDTRMGKMRAANGHPEPYGVKWWSIGNEMWGDFQFGYMALKQFVHKHNLFGEAMLKVDPTLTLIATGRAAGTVEEIGTDKDWTGGLFTNCLPYIEVMSEHYYASAPPDAPLTDALYSAANAVRAKVEAYEHYYRRIPGLQTKKVPMAIDEWAFTGTRGTGMRGGLRDVLANALAFHEMFRHTDMIAMAAHTMGTSSIDFNAHTSALNATGLQFKLYRDHMGTVPLHVGGNSPAPAPARAKEGRFPQVHAGSPTYPLDVSAALSADGKLLTIAVVNPTESARDLDITIEGARLRAPGRMWRLTGPSLTATTGLDRQEVQVTEEVVKTAPGRLRVAPISIEIYEFEKMP
ncbi:MAG: alpha-N-arabinofuranosidase [bacterium]